MKTFYSTFSKSPYKLFYNAFVPRKTRKKWQYRYSELPMQTQTSEFWQGKISQLNNFETLIDDILFPQTQLVGQKIIWQFWSQGFDELPENIQTCMASVKQHAGEYQVIKLDEKNYQDYVVFPDYIEAARQEHIPKTAHFSDLLRTALLYFYGGVWLDASILMTNKIPSQIQSLPLFMYQRDSNSAQQSWGKNDQHFYFNWRTEFKITFLNCILLATPNNLVMKHVLMLLMDFWQQKTPVPHYFFYQILLNQLAKTHADLANMPIFDDTLPHLLQSKLNQPFDLKEFEAICDETVFHKIGTRHHYKNNTFFGKQTFFGYLLAQNLLSTKR